MTGSQMRKDSSLDSGIALLHDMVMHDRHCMGHILMPATNLDSIHDQSRRAGWTETVVFVVVFH